MNTADLKLRQIHLPELSGFESIPMGWWLILLFIPLVLFSLFWLYKRITQQTVVKSAQKILLTLKENTAKSPQEKIMLISALLRRTSMSLDSRSECAGLTGEAWVVYLDGLWAKKAFNSSLGEILINAPYQQKAPTEDEISQLISLTEKWLNAQK